MENTFSRKLGPLGFNIYNMLVVNLLHEFELCVWKALFIHLLWILEAYDKTLLVELNCRYMIDVWGEFDDPPGKLMTLLKI